MRWTRTIGLALLAAALLLCGLALAGPTTTPLLSLYFVPDITVLLNGVTVSPQEVAIDDLQGTITRLSIGDVPDGTRITSFVELGGGHRLLTFDTTVDLGDGVIAHPADVVSVTPSSVQILFDAAAHGVPEGAIVGALTMAQGDDLVMSFDVTVKLGDLTASPSDLVRLEPDDTFSMFFDGTAAGVPPGLHIDAAQALQPSGHLLLSFDGSGIIGNPAIAFDDEDILEYDPDTDTWQLAYDGSADAPGWAPGDLAALFAFQQPAPTPTSVPTTTGTLPATATATASATPPEPTSTPTVVSTGPPTATVTGSPPATSTPTQAAVCAGDCNGSGEVTINELVLIVNIALGNTPVSQCEAADTDQNGAVAVNEIVAAVVSALGSCG